MDILKLKKTLFVGICCGFPRVHLPFKGSTMRAFGLATSDCCLSLSQGTTLAKPNQKNCGIPRNFQRTCVLGRTGFQVRILAEISMYVLHPTSEPSMYSDYILIKLFFGKIGQSKMNPPKYGNSHPLLTQLKPISTDFTSCIWNKVTPEYELETTTTTELLKAGSSLTLRWIGGPIARAQLCNISDHTSN